MTIEVKRLGAGDEVPLASLFDAVLPGFSGSLLEPSGPQSFLDDQASFVFGAYLSDVPAGLAWGLQMRYPNGRLVTYLHELDVIESFRRQGVGRTLVEESMRLARERGSTRFWLSTGGHNEVAQSLYDSIDGVRKPRGDVNYWWEL